ncbi:MAG: ribonuclease HII [Rhizobiales bacterium]|nr:ribonuclease HII [Hyphomicrobiales bacterium]
MAKKEEKTKGSNRLSISEEGPNFQFETEALEKFGGCVAGTDEAGRGPWAGPVVAGAVILNPDDIPVGLNDSKKLTEAKREALFELMTEMAAEERLYIGVGIADVERIDNDNILKASLWAMGQSVADLSIRPRSVLVDGNKLPELPVPALALVKGDGRSLSIAAASIIAKVTRDRMMVELSEAYPAYKWASNKGYGTKDHQQALAEHGVTVHHRRSFKPIRALL